MEQELSRISFLLSRMALFKGLSQAFIDEVAQDFVLFNLSPGERLYAEGDDGDSFYIVFSGKIRLTRQEADKEALYATLMDGDHFGEEALILGIPRPLTATAVEASRILRLSGERFFELLGRENVLFRRLKTSINSRILARQKNPSWLSEEETVYLFSRKDRAYLIISLALPVLLGWFALFVIYMGFTMDPGPFNTIIEYIGIALFGISLIWGIWNYIDWTNDYYIVTNQRVIWLEKIIFLYESRQEAPMDTVLTVGSNTDLVGRILNFGDVRVKTFTGMIVMRHVGHPEYALSLIEELILRARQVAKRVETAALERAIRVRLGLQEDISTEKPPLPNVTAPPAQRGENPFRFLIDIFRVRYEEEDMVTYRRHWLVLAGRAWRSSLALLLMLVIFGMRFFGPLQILSPGYFLLFWFIITFGFSLWWLYEYIDWRNDIYQVTEEHIVDVYKKPLGEVDKKTAPLENILSLHHEQTGIIRLLLNYGDVVAMVGTARFTFDGVYNPSEVVQDIFLRMNARKRRMREAEAAQERERIADWLAAYHRQADVIRGDTNSNNIGQNSG
jgi:CRP-like cAMP-binding protein